MKNVLVTIFGVMMVLVSTTSVSAAVLEDSDAGFVYEYSDDWTREDWTERVRSTNVNNSDVLGYYTFGKETSLGAATVSLIVRDRRGDDYMEYLKDSVISVKEKRNVTLYNRIAVELSGLKYGTSEKMTIVLIPLEKMSYELRLKGDRNGGLYRDMIAGFQIRSGFSDGWGHLHERAILRVSEAGLVSGYDDGTFRPDRSINRAEFVKMLVLSDPDLTDSFMSSWYDVQVGGKNYAYVQFPDVEVDAWYAKYILYAFHKGWVNGYEDGLFRPANVINFAEAMKLILERNRPLLLKSFGGQGVESSELRDGSEPWFMKYARFMDERGVIDLGGDETWFAFSGLGKGKGFADALKRGEMAEFLTRFMVLDEHPGLKTYGEVIENERSFPEFEYGRFLWRLNEWNTGEYVLKQTGFDVNHRVYELSDVTLEEVSIGLIHEFPWLRQDTGDLFDRFEYLDEDGERVYLFESSGCELKDCLEIEQSIQETFRVMSKGMESYSAADFGISFHYRSGITLEVLPSQAFSLLVSAGEEDRMTIDVLKGSAGKYASYNGLDPIGQLRYKMNWQYYVVPEDEKVFLTAVLGNDLLVVFAEGQLIYDDFLPELQGVVRTMGR
jgi:hypothetical protein